MKTRKDLKLGNNVIIEEGVLFGSNITLGDNVVIRKGAIIGDNVIIGYRDIKPYDKDIKCLSTEIGENVLIRSGNVIYHGFKIGNNSMVGHNTVIREKTIIGHDSYIGSLVMLEGDTNVGNYVGIGAGSHITKFSNIADYTFMGSLCISTNDKGMKHRRAGHGENLVGFTAEKYVRIGSGAILLPGVHLGEGCIVGAGSVVTKDVPPYKVAMGNPARVVSDAPRDEIPS